MQRSSAFLKIALFFNLTPMQYFAPVVALCTFVGSAWVHSANAANDQTEACFASLHLAHTTLEPCIGALASLPEQSIESAQVFSAMALVHAKQTNLIAARNAMDAALSITVDDATVQGNLGSLLIAEGDFSGAVLAYNDALQLASEQITHAALYLNRSLALRAMGRYDEAAADFDLYLTLGGLIPALPSIGPTQVQPTAEEKLPKIETNFR